MRTFRPHPLIYTVGSIAAVKVLPSRRVISLLVSGQLACQDSFEALYRLSFVS